MLDIFCLLRHKSLFLVTCIFLTGIFFYFGIQEMYYCSDDAVWTRQQKRQLKQKYIGERCFESKELLSEPRNNGSTLVWLDILKCR